MQLLKLESGKDLAGRSRGPGAPKIARRREEGRDTSGQPRHNMKQMWNINEKETSKKVQIGREGEIYVDNVFAEDDLVHVVDVGVPSLYLGLLMRRKYIFGKNQTFLIDLEQNLSCGDTFLWY